MKTEAILFAAAALLCCASTPSFAANVNKKYCLNPASGGSSCSFDSMEQCQETMRGRNGWCSEQVDFDNRETSGNWSVVRPENSFAYYPPGGHFTREKVPPAARDMEELHKKDMPAKGVGAE